MTNSYMMLPISDRNFLLGLVPSPRSVPETTFDDLIAAYQETGEIAEVSMVWTDPAGIGEYDKLSQNQVVTALRVYGLEPILTLNFATIQQAPGEGLIYVVDAPRGVNADLSDSEFRRLWIEEAKNIARDFKPKYFSLGNEINDYFYFHPEDWEEYLSLYDQARAEIKAVSPDTKVFAVFSLNHMLENNQFDLLETFNDRADLIGFTTYPWQEYNDPIDIPIDYYSQLQDYVNKPIAFTEIGWPSSQEQGSSEQEQAEFLIRFLELTKDMDLEMVNWLFLHTPELSGIAAVVSSPGTETISLKNADDSQKAIYPVWLALKALEGQHE
ncbi:MAG: glycosyl hydrolase 53 family protein [Chloroflexota bacterium]